MLSGLTPAEIGMNTDILGSGKSWEPVFRWSMRTDGLAVATARLPEDCLRLLAFRMGSWEVELRDVTFSDSLRRSPVEELRGTPERPRLYLLPSDGGVQLEIQACASIGEDCLCALYLPRPTWSSPQDSESTISLPHSLLPSLCKATAAHFTA